MTTLHPGAALLRDLEPIKTWSLIVTLFGDMSSASVTGTEIRTLLEHLGIRPEAIRVALHRLKRDAWVSSTKLGREAVYALADKGRRETEAVYSDVYRRDMKYPGGWRFLATDGPLAPDAGIQDGVRFSADLILVPQDLTLDLTGALDLRLAHQDLPDWVEPRLVPPQFVRNADALIRVLSQARAGGASASALDDTALRLLVLHHWRRIALRPASWAHMSLLPDGILARCQVCVTEFLHERARIDLAAISTPIA
ncbi:MAG: hypothetical protein AAGF79_01505 [Pseudomonadota bacterium]